MPEKSNPGIGEYRGVLRGATIEQLPAEDPLPRQADELFNRLEQISDTLGGLNVFTWQRPVKGYRKEQEFNVQLHNLIKSRLAHPEKVSREEIEAFLLTAKSPEHLVWVNAIEMMLAAHIILHLMKGEYEAASALFDKCKNRFPKLLFSGKWLYMTCLSTPDCPETEKMKYKSILLGRGYNPEDLNNLTEEYEAPRKKADIIAGHIRERLGNRRVDLTLNLGSGLANFGADAPGAIEIDYKDVGLPSSVKSHPGKLRYIVISGKGVLILDGRAPHYNGHDMEEVARTMRVAGLLAEKKIHILTCAAGGLNQKYAPGQLVLVRDHINLIQESPLRLGMPGTGPVIRFPDMEHVYDHELCELAKAAGRDALVKLAEGVMLAIPGPQYETPKEAEFYRKKDIEGGLGCDLITMGVAPEATVLRDMGARTLAIACIANNSAGTGQSLSHEEVMKVMKKAAPQFTKLLQYIIAKIE